MTTDEAPSASLVINQLSQSCGTQPAERVNATSHAIGQKITATVGDQDTLPRASPRWALLSSMHYRDPSSRNHGPFPPDNHCCGSGFHFRPFLLPLIWCLSAIVSLKPPLFFGYHFFIIIISLISCLSSSSYHICIIRRCI